MGNLFSLDGKLFGGFNKIADYILLNFFWFLTSIPIFTIGASSTAFYYTMRKSIKLGKGYVAHEFFKTFKKEFKQSTIIWMIFVLIYLFLSFDYVILFLAGETGSVDKLASKVFLIFIIITIIWVLYTFPYLARFENKTKVVLKNAWILAIIHFMKSIVLLLLFLLTVFILYLLPISIFIVPAIYMSIQVSILESIFAKYITDEPMEE